MTSSDAENDTAPGPFPNAKYTPLRANGPLPLDMIRAVPAISRNPLAWLEGAVARYGDLVAFPMPRSAVLLANTPAAARQVLQQNHPNYTKATIQYGSLSAVTGQGLLTSDNPAWRTHRRAVQPAFHPSGLEPMAVTTMQAAALDRAAGPWDGEAWGSGGERLVDADAASMRTMLAVVTACLFSARTGAEGEQVVNAVDTALHAVVARARSPLVGPLAKLPTPSRIRQQRAVVTLDAAVQTLISRRRAEQRSGEPQEGSGEPREGSGEPREGSGEPREAGDLLGMLLQAQDAGIIDASGVRDEIVTMIIAGYETVASSLAWTLDLLADAPQVQRDLHAELDQQLKGRSPGWGDLSRLPLTGAVVRESLRLYPPAWVITRRATGPDRIEGVDIPAGTLVILSPWLLHRRAGDWPDPLRFDPRRFLDQDGQPAWTDRLPAYLPFGAGPRLCIGRDVALMQATLVLAGLLQGRRLRRPPNSAPTRVDALVTLRPRGGLPLLLARR